LDRDLVGWKSNTGAIKQLLAPNQYLGQREGG
jgi:hypothetical protein